MKNLHRVSIRQILEPFLGYKRVRYTFDFLILYRRIQSKLLNILPEEYSKLKIPFLKKGSLKNNRAYALDDLQNRMSFLICIFSIS